jgi:hypothetical protein
MTLLAGYTDAQLRRLDTDAARAELIQRGLLPDPRAKENRAKQDAARMFERTDRYERPRRFER